MKKNEENCMVTLRRLYPSMSEAGRKISDVILRSPEGVINATVASLSKTAGVSEGSVIRLCQQLGFSGFTQLKINVAKFSGDTDDFIPKGIVQSDRPTETVRSVFECCIQALNQTIRIMQEDQVDLAVNMLEKADKIEFYGIGTSAMVAKDAYYRFMRIGMPAYAVTDPHILRISADRLNSQSVAVGISHTGRTVETVRALEIAKSRKAGIICITNFIKSPIAGLSDAKLITSSCENQLQEAVTSRTSQITLLDGICAYLTMKKLAADSSLMTRIAQYLNEDRI